MPANFLNLPDYAVVAMDQDDHDYHIKVEVVSGTESCQHCGAYSLVGFGRREQMIRDLPMHGKRVGIYVNTRRYQCKTCSKTFSEALPEVDEKRLMTCRLVNWMGQQSIRRTFAGIAEEIGCSEGTVRQVFGDFVESLEAKHKFETPVRMGIDEIHLIKPRGVITNTLNNTLVELLPDRNKATIISYLAALKDADKIESVSMDMWAPYRDACKLILPDAVIVVDKFHVVRMANDALERVRKRMRADLAPKVRRTLMHDRFVLLKRESQLSDQDFLLLDGWRKNYPLLNEAYHLKESFYGIYDAPNTEEALRRYEVWRKGIPPEVFSDFSDLARAFENWMPQILNYFSHPVTNAYTESLNNLIRVMSPS